MIMASSQGLAMNLPTCRNAMRAAAAFALGLCLIGGAAQADVGARAAAPAPALKVSLAAVQVAQAPALPLMSYSRNARALPAGTVRTSVERRFSGLDSAVGEAGFLCGLLPHPDTSGAAAAYGHDPDGRFVGAKLRLSF
jgi:hypothetical protein